MTRGCPNHIKQHRLTFSIFKCRCLLSEMTEICHQNEAMFSKYYLVHHCKKKMLWGSSSALLCGNRFPGIVACFQAAYTFWLIGTLAMTAVVPQWCLFHLMNQMQGPVQFDKISHAVSQCFWGTKSDEDLAVAFYLISCQPLSGTSSHPQVQHSQAMNCCCTKRHCSASECLLYTGKPLCASTRSRAMWPNKPTERSSTDAEAPNIASLRILLRSLEVQVLGRARKMGCSSSFAVCCWQRHWNEIPISFCKITERKGTTNIDKIRQGSWAIPSTAKHLCPCIFSNHQNILKAWTTCWQSRGWCEKTPIFPVSLSLFRNVLFLVVSQKECYHVHLCSIFWQSLCSSLLHPWPIWPRNSVVGDVSSDLRSFLLGQWGSHWPFDGKSTFMFALVYADWKTS